MFGHQRSTRLHDNNILKIIDTVFTSKQINGKHKFENFVGIPVNVDNNIWKVFRIFPSGIPL